MSDEGIVEELRECAADSRASEGDYYADQYSTDPDIFDRAAAEIERLRAENAKLRAMCEIPPGVRVP